MDWVLYDRDLPHEKVNQFQPIAAFLFLSATYGARYSRMDRIKFLEESL